MFLLLPETKFQNVKKMLLFSITKISKFQNYFAHLWEAQSCNQLGQGHDAGELVGPGLGRKSEVPQHLSQVVRPVLPEITLCEVSELAFQIL